MAQRRRAVVSTASRNGYLRPPTRLGTCITPSASGSGASTRASSQRQGSVGAQGSRSRRSGQREASSRPLTPGRAGSAVVHWKGSPIRARSRASSPLGGVPRNSASATASASQAAICRAMAAARTPPPARMFQKTTRIGSSGYLSSQTSWSRQQL